MTFQQQEFHCPKCNEPAHGIEEIIPGVALFGEPVSQGETIQVEYFGETEVDWDGQRSVIDANGCITLVCRNGHRWPAKCDERKSSSLSVSSGD